MQKFIWHSVGLIILLLSIYTINFLLCYDILTDHDLVFSFGRTFLDPEHGRYIASYINNVLTERLPEIFNIHPNDFQPVYMASIKGILVIIMCILISSSSFVFTDKKDYSFKFIPYYHFSFLFIYVVVFLSLFNNNFFYNNVRMYFNVFENTVFFEYPLSLIYYVPFICIFAYYFVNKKIPEKNNFIILLILTFLTGISIEPVNISVSISIFIFFIIFVINIIKSANRKALLPIALFFMAYFISVILFFIHPNEHNPDFNGEFFDYINKNFLLFLKTYLISLKQLSYFLIPLTIMLISIFFYRNNNSEQNKRYVYFVCINIFGFLLFNFLTFFIGFVNSGNFYIFFDKWFIFSKIVSLIFSLMSLGYLLDSCINNNKISESVKIIVCIVILIIFRNNLLFDYWSNLTDTQAKTKKLREVSYIIEKISTTQNTNDIIIPESFSIYNETLWFDQVKFENCSYDVYIKNVYPKITKNKIVLDENINVDNLLTEKENKELKFSSLLQERRVRTKKVILGCY